MSSIDSIPEDPVSLEQCLEELRIVQRLNADIMVLNHEIHYLRLKKEGQDADAWLSNESDLAKKRGKGFERDIIRLKADVRELQRELRSRARAPEASTGGKSQG